MVIPASPGVNSSTLVGQGSRVAGLHHRRESAGLAVVRMVGDRPLRKSVDGGDVDVEPPAHPERREGDSGHPDPSDVLHPREKGRPGGRGHPATGSLPPVSHTRNKQPRVSLSSLRPPLNEPAPWTPGLARRETNRTRTTVLGRCLGEATCSSSIRKGLQYGPVIHEDRPSWKDRHDAISPLDLPGMGGRIARPRHALCG